MLRFALLSHIIRALFGESLKVSQSEWAARSGKWDAKADQWKTSACCSKWGWIEFYNA